MAIPHGQKSLFQFKRNHPFNNHYKFKHITLPHKHLYKSSFTCGVNYWTFFVDCKFWEVTTVSLKLYYFSIALMILTQTTWVRKGGLLLKWSLDHDNLVYKKIPFELLITGVGKKSPRLPNIQNVCIVRTIVS